MADETEAPLQMEDDTSALQPTDSLPNIDSPMDIRRFSKQQRKNFEPPKDENGQFYCDYPEPLGEECTNLRFNRKCEYHKHMDKHLRPHVCQVPNCKQPGFTYPGGLRRHEAEVHGMHGGPKEKLYCPYPYCKRNSGEPFTRRENMQEHISRLHTKSKENKDDTTAEEEPIVLGNGDDADPADGEAGASSIAPTSAQPATEDGTLEQQPPSAETLAAAANAAGGGPINPNIDPAFTQDDPPTTTTPTSAPRATTTTNRKPATSTPVQRKSKKRKTGQTTFKPSGYTSAAVAAAISAQIPPAAMPSPQQPSNTDNGSETNNENGNHVNGGGGGGSSSQQLRNLVDKVATLEEQNARLHMENDFLRQNNNALREETVRLSETLASITAADGDVPGVGDA